MTPQPVAHFQIAPEWADEIDQAQIDAALRHSLAAEGQPPESSLSIVIVGDEEMAYYHEQYRHEPGPTDVLSFPYDDDALDEEMAHYLGDVIIGYEQAARQAAEQGHSTAEELVLIAVHGLLHLLGYDDEAPTARATMWQRQREILTDLGLGHVVPGDG